MYSYFESEGTLYSKSWEPTDTTSATYTLTSKIISDDYNEIDKTKHLRIINLNEFTKDDGKTLKLYEDINGKIKQYNVANYSDCTIISGNVTNTDVTPNKLIMVISSTLVSDALKILYNKYDSNTVNNFNITGKLKHNLSPTITGYILNTVCKNSTITRLINNRLLNLTNTIISKDQFNILNINFSTDITLDSTKFYIYYDEKIKVLPNKELTLNVPVGKGGIIDIMPGRFCIKC
jgi:hypothetical protein